MRHICRSVGCGDLLSTVVRLELAEAEHVLYLIPILNFSSVLDLLSLPHLGFSFFVSQELLLFLSETFQFLVLLKFSWQIEQGGLDSQTPFLLGCLSRI